MTAIIPHTPFTSIRAVIGGEETDAVDARSPHTWLGVGRDFSNWFKARADEALFIEGEEFETRSPNLASDPRGWNRVDYVLTVDAAMHVAMLERTEIGRMVRQDAIEWKKRAKAMQRHGNAVTTLTGLEYARALVAAEERIEAERAAHALTIVENKLVIATKEGVQECIFANALAKQINQALGKAMVDLKRFPRWAEEDGGEFFNRGFIEKQANGAHQLWFHVTKPQRASPQCPGEKLYNGWIIQITPIGQTGITNKVLRDRNRVLPIYRSAYQNTPLRIVGGEL